jgi:hypothetical protein
VSFVKQRMLIVFPPSLSEAEFTWYCGQYWPIVPGPDDDFGPIGWMRIGRRNEVLEENLPHCHFVYHKPHMIWPGLEPGPRRWEMRVVIWTLSKQLTTHSRVHELTWKIKSRGLMYRVSVVTEPPSQMQSLKCRFWGSWSQSTPPCRWPSIIYCISFDAA